MLVRLGSAATCQLLCSHLFFEFVVSGTGPVVVAVLGPCFWFPYFFSPFEVGSNMIPQTEELADLWGPGFELERASLCAVDFPSCSLLVFLAVANGFGHFVNCLEIRPL